ncbi:DUF4153 domain-containing protein [Streptosporangium sp. NPDC023615]|uniref:DUF4153 domain-containing protein n=1 Tax=Streptosporangium sp. NPDC023615 TaxID=3154794 RepID=UPI00341A299B
MRPLDFLGRIKAKLGMVILLAVVTAFVVNEVGINAGYSRDVRVAVAAVFALIMVQLLARGMTKPLREMAAAAQTIAKGRYGLRVTATSRDEVGELARAFNAMAADLGEVDRQRRELVANVSHELRTPITALRAVLENVVDGVSDPDPATLGTALAQTERLGRLVAQLLDLSRLESGARLIEREDVELRPLCEQALREAVLAREGVTARCEVPEGLSLRADPDLLAQVLANLLDNAVRHSPAGGTVVLAAAASGDGVRLRVSDQGPGIAAEDRARAFERFSRLDAGRATDDGGAGLGLAITKEIVELHGGSIHVEDGVGCHVVTDLPERIEMTSPSSPVAGPPVPDPPVQDAAARDSSAPSPSAQSPSAQSPSAQDSPAQDSPVRDSPVRDSPVPDSSARRSSAQVPAAQGSPVPSSPAQVPAAQGPPARSSPAQGSPAVEVRQDVPDRVAADAGALVPTAPGRAPADGTPPGERPEPPGSSEPGGPGEGVGPDGAGTPDTSPPAHTGAPPGHTGAPGHTSPPFPPRPVLVGGGSTRPERVVVRNWAGAIIGVFLGGVAGVICALIVGTVLSALDSMLGLTAGAGLFVAGGFIGTVLGATTSFDDISGGQEPLPYRPPAQGPATTAAEVVGTASTASTASVASTQSTASMPSAPSATPTTSAQATQPAGTAVLSRPQATTPGRRGTGGYQAPPILPRPDLPDTPRWVLPASGAVGLLGAVVVPYSGAGLGLVLVAVAMGAAVIPAVRGRITAWSVVLGALAYGLVVTVMFRDADWLVAVVSLAGFLTAALALSGAGRGWLGVIRGGASVILGLLPVPWFLGARLRALAARRRVVPALLGGGLTVVLLVVFGALFASADAVFAEAVERVLSVQDWAESMPLRIVLFLVLASVVASAVLVGLQPVAEPRTPSLRVAAGRSLWVLPLTALNLLFVTFVVMQLAVLFGSTRWLVSATGLTYAEYARSGFFQLVVVSVFVLAIVGVASGALELKGFDRWLMAGLLGLLCVLTLVILVSALHRLDLYSDAYGLSRLRASVAATVWWLGGVFALVLAAGAARLVGREQARWLPRALVVMTSASLLAFALWNPDLRVAETQIAVRGLPGADLEYLGDLGAEAVPALDRLPEPTRSCVLRDVVTTNHLAESDPWNGWNLARRQARELLAQRPVLQGGRCPRTLSRLDVPYQD